MLSYTAAAAAAAKSLQSCLTLRDPIDTTICKTQIGVHMGKKRVQFLQQINYKEKKENENEIYN